MTITVLTVRTWSTGIYARRPDVPNDVSWSMAHDMDERMEIMLHNATDSEREDVQAAVARAAR